MKRKVMYLLVVILVTLILFPKEITFATFPNTSDFDEPKIVIITPCSRPENLELIKKSIDLSKIKRWYISYDCQDNKMEYKQRYPNEPNIKELKCVRPSITGNGPRNEALDEIAKSEGQCLVCFLDDDNLIHPEMLKKDFKFDKLYTWDLLRGGAPYTGNNMKVGYVDTAQILVDMNIVGNTRWGTADEAVGKNVRAKNSDAADANFILSLWENNKDKWEYIPETLGYYNALG